MPTRIYVELQPLQRQSQGGDGPAIQAAFLSTIGAQYPELVDELHRPGGGSRPYCVTTTRKTQGTVGLELGLLDDTIAPAVVEALDQVDQLQTHRGARRYRLEQGDVFGVSYDELVCTPPESRTWNVELVSPFAVRHPLPSGRSRQLVMPDPATFVSALERRFKRFSPVSLPIPSATWLERVVVSRIDELRTKLHLVETHPRQIKVAGTVGSFRTQMLDHTPDELRSWGTLMEFANFGGLGDKTTVGMGHVRCSPFQRPERTKPPKRRPNRQDSAWV